MLHLRYSIHKPRVNIQQLQPRHPQPSIIEDQILFHLIRGVLLQHLHVLLGSLGSRTLSDYKLLALSFFLCHLSPQFQGKWDFVAEHVLLHEVLA